ncbi:pyrroloquinoline quinone biosynthesis protein PqqE [Tengunoibacter tsumagoiensis]|uniref:PqqA peptide cyclase n=1 Tax=Tengunoibacter tsumagoiensis TaxID=2014871 RepID=A0A402A2H3_9CHLR|nr:pyrroloquinoline quinone biosynthesis protein PqqE [Tengunoibacter tsumagoiensis]GCE13256.1 coenzyme PQQ synthesis protein E [Tengunoibacter tsumagoiensis]
MDQQPVVVAPQTSHTTTTNHYRAFGLLAELTYRCPLHCPYCSNPLQVAQKQSELTTNEWLRVIQEASELGILHILFSGGEPLLRRDIVQLVASAQQTGMYTNLITSGLGFTRHRAQELKAAGLDSVQISFQADQAELADLIAGARAHQRKLAAARLARELGFPLTLNVVLHRENIERLSEIIALAEELDAQRLELANTQFLGWAFQNKEVLLPTRQQVTDAHHTATAAQLRLRGKMEVLYILPDYYGERPKPCLFGWGQRFLTVNPMGNVLPCQTAGEIPTIQFDNIREHSLPWIWEHSSAFKLFRGTAWMPEPCRSCPHKETDFGGCRCQAFLITGDPAQTDPTCDLSPHHLQLTQMVEQLQQSATRHFTPENARKIRFRTDPISSRDN